MKLSIPRCYDSHVHFLPTGEYLSILNLRAVKTLDQVAALLRAAGPESFRGEFLVGYGWGSELATELEQKYAGQPRLFLDEMNFPHGVALSQQDGHASWVNSHVLKKLGWTRASDVPEDLRLQVPADQNGDSTGLLLEKAHFKKLELFPPVSTVLRETYLLKAQDLFLKEGFSHVREMMANDELFWDLCRLEQTGQLKLYFELNYSVQRLADFEATLRLMKNHQLEAPTRIRPQGLKVFMDGALGSEGAFLSFPYAGGHGQGQLLWTAAETETLMRRSFQESVPLAFHCIGDASLDLVLETAQKLRREGLEGAISLEHAEVIHPDSFAKMKGLSLNFHFQPSHYLGDSAWLKQKLGEHFEWCFPWHRIEKMGFPIFFGSDSPIVEASLKNTLAGLKKAAEDGLPACELDWKFAHSHPDRSWGKEAVTEVDENAQVLKAPAL